MNTIKTGLLLGALTGLLMLIGGYFGGKGDELGGILVFRQAGFTDVQRTAGIGK
jgi:hypothetical protein